MPPQFKLKPAHSIGFSSTVVVRKQYVFHCPLSHDPGGGVVRHKRTQFPKIEIKAKVSYVLPT